MVNDETHYTSTDGAAKQVEVSKEIMNTIEKKCPYFSHSEHSGGSGMNVLLQGKK